MKSKMIVSSARGKFCPKYYVTQCYRKRFQIASQVDSLIFLSYFSITMIDRIGIVLC